MNLAVKILKIVATMTDHWSRERGHCFYGNFYRSRSEKLVVTLHQENVERRTRLRNRYGVAGRRTPNPQLEDSVAKESASPTRTGSDNSVSFDEADVAAAL